jgi:hypothetical protein
MYSWRRNIKYQFDPTRAWTRYLQYLRQAC